MAVRGGLTRFARPAGSPLTCVHLFVQLAVASCRPPVGASHPPGVCNTRKKSPYFRTSSSLNMAVRGGLTRFARPAGSPLTAFTVCPTGCRQLSTPGRGFSSPRCVQYTKKKPVLSYELFFKYGGEGGIDSLRSPCGQPAHCVHGLSNWLSPVVEPRSGLLIPPVCAIYEKPVLSYELFKYGGEGFRTLDTLPHTTLSVRAPSATRTPHQIVVPVLLERALI